MNQQRGILFLLIGFACFKGLSQNLPLLPLPASLQTDTGYFVLQSGNTVLIADKPFVKEGEHFRIRLEKETGFRLRTGKNGTGIRLVYQKSDRPEGSYDLKINRTGIRISSNTATGIFYGLHSLQQLMPAADLDEIMLPALAITDSPAYTWRGMHLDCSRHFFSVDFVKRYIDLLSSYKMNTFHWHLTDDQGWRIEIKKYPKLTQVGAWRKGSMIGHYTEQRFDSIRYGGFYTQDEIRNVIKYAAERHVTVVPEIEMPGHSLAAIASYPHLSCSGKAVDVGIAWGIEKNVLCPTESTFSFLIEVLKEVSDLFPGPYIHIGGDEVLKAEWDSSEYCRQLMKQENLKDAHALQSYFIRRVEKIVNSFGKQMIGWDEILEGGLAPNAIVMSWRGMDGGIAAAKLNHKVVMCPASHCYFDHYQGLKEEEPLAIGGFTPLEKTYGFHPTPDSLNAAESNFILGAQGNVWTEYVNTPEQVEYMAFPRLIGLAEVLWTPTDRKVYYDFMNRLKAHRSWMDLRKINYAKTAFKN